LLPYIFSKNNFYVTVTDPTYANLNWISDLSIYEDYKNVKAYNTKEKYTDIWLYENDLKLQKTGETIKRNMFWYAIHKGVPLLFRDLIYIKGNWCSPILNNSLRLTLNSYSVLDYLPRLTEITNESINTALIMTNDTTHENSFLQAPEYRPVKNVTDYGKSRFAKEWSYHVNAGALLRIAEWIQFLKNENVYDNTRIIIVSDHGPEPNYMIKLGLPFNVEQFNPLLLVKDFNETGNLKTDMAFMSNADVPYLSLSGIVENPVNPFTGNKISMDRKNEPLYISITGSFNISSKNDTQYNLNQSEDFYVHKNIFSAENWIKASKFNEK